MIIACSILAFLGYYIGENEAGKRIKLALFETLNAGIKTADIGGSATTTEFTQAIIDRLAVLEK